MSEVCIVLYVWYVCRCMYVCMGPTDCRFFCSEIKKDGNEMLKSLDLLIRRVCMCVCVSEPAGDVLVTRLLLHEKGRGGEGLYGFIHWMSAACCWPQNKKMKNKTTTATGP
ncbi:hypothetical protein LY76DRAFT_107907 [Colletotrichum caudatum]|nr:hypothetical protein LY76DRAFT_107907 [Colletotrichum caudatum]